jgi:predicted Zn-dependent protease
MLMAVCAVVASGCSTVPGTGRSQLILVSQAEEKELGLTEFEKMKKSTPISKDAAINALVQRVGKRIAAVAQADMPGAAWEFVVFDQPKTANAFCLPGGKVGIYTGILPVTKDEAGMATVIGHEVAHAVARHGAERLSEALLLQLGGVALSTAMRNNSDQARAMAMGAYGVTGTVGVMLPHSRKQELEADRMGLIYMARAGYDPRQAVDFWKRFGEYGRQQGGARIEFLSTHPVDTTRIGQIETLLPEAMREYQRVTGGY